LCIPDVGPESQVLQVVRHEAQRQLEVGIVARLRRRRAWFLSWRLRVWLMGTAGSFCASHLEAGQVRPHEQPEKAIAPGGLLRRKARRHAPTARAA
jgi:hypothetical protein